MLILFYFKKSDIVTALFIYRDRFTFSMILPAWANPYPTQDAGAESNFCSEMAVMLNMS